MKILLDMDDCAEQMWAKTARISNERWGTNYDTSLMSIPEWDWSELKANDGRLYRLWLEDGFFKDVEPWDGIVEVLPRLAQKHDVIFVTASHYTTVKDKAEWIISHFPFLTFGENVIITGRKELIPGDILFDDNSKKNLANWKKAHQQGIGIAMMAGYNEEWPIRVTDWFKFEVLVGWIDKIKGRHGKDYPVEKLEGDCRLICSLFREGYKPENVARLIGLTNV